MRIIDLPPNEPGCEAYSGRPGSARTKPRASRNLACGVHTARRTGFGAAGGRMLVSGSGPVVRRAQAGMKLDELDVVVPHQANGRIVEAIRSRLRLAEDRVWNDKRRQGNTSRRVPFHWPWIPCCVRAVPIGRLDCVRLDPVIPMVQRCCGSADARLTNTPTNAGYLCGAPFW
jgi:hypothetical protein